MIDRNDKNIVEFDVGVDRLLNIAYKKIDKSEYVNAVSILKKALVEDPENVDVLLELASVYSKMNMIDKSNRFAYLALDLKHNEMSLYLLGNNFLKLHMYDEGIEYFNRIIDMYPDGDYADYVELVIDRLEDKEVTGRELKLLNLTQKGKKYLENEEYDKAIKLFSRVSMAVPEHNFIKNNLAMAYFYDKQTEKSIKLCKEVIATSRYDIYANCNLALFYHRLNKKHELNKQLDKLLKLEPVTQEEYLKIISIYCEMKRHEDVIRVVKQAGMVYSYDITYMYFLAAANYNLGNVNKSLSIYHDIIKIDEDNFEAYYYIKSINSLMKPKSIDYYNQLPMVAVIDCVKQIKAMMDMTREELVKNWTEENRLIAMWGLRYRDDGVKRLCISILSVVDDEDSKRALKEALFSTSMSDEVKKDILANLQFMGVPQPYPAYFAGDILNVKVSVSTIDNTKSLEKPQKAIDIFKNGIRGEEDPDMLKECIEMYVLILNMGMEVNFRSTNALCAVIEMSVCEMNAIEYDKSDIIKRYKTTAKTFDAYCQKLSDILFDAKQDKE